MAETTAVCTKCGQEDIDQTGEYACPECALPQLWDRDFKTREKLAAYAHDAWAGWMRWLFKFGTQNDDGTFTMDADKVTRWRRQATTEYADLPDEEKKSDRTEADRMLAIVYNGAQR